MSLLRLTGAASAAALILGFSAGAQQGPNFDAVEITSVDLGGGLYMLLGQGGNIGLSTGPDGVLMVDDQFAPLSAKISAKIEELAGSAGGPRFVLNTHHHGDHTGGNDNFAAAGATIVAHDNVRAHLVSPPPAADGTAPPPRETVSWPVVTFADSVTFHMNGQTVHAIHVPPAHTDGDSIVWFEEANLIHMGDTVSWNSYPRADVPGGGSLAGFVTAADAALAIADDETRILCGHGAAEPLTKAQLQEYRDMAQAVTDILTPLAAGDRSIDDIVAADPLASLNGRWGMGSQTPEAFIRGAVAGLRAATP
jgi:glyoxylase-like metal-dependent hydrolase (beta-lactamase superfamily II)